jgi:hypothetical protein
MYNAIDVTEQKTFSFVEDEKVKQSEIKKIDLIVSMREIILDSIEEHSEFNEPFVKSIYGSPILTGNDFSFYENKPFETVIAWSPAKIILQRIQETNEIDIECFRNWAYEFHLKPLVEIEQTAHVLGLEPIKAIEYLNTLPEHDLLSFVDFCLPRFQDLLHPEWSTAMLDVHIGILTRLNLLRLGKIKLPNESRIWIGRIPQEGSPKVKFEVLEDDSSAWAEQMVRKFLGENCSKQNWILGYRGGLWRFQVGNKKNKNFFYFEEVELAE